MDHQEWIETTSTYKGACNMGKNGLRKVKPHFGSGCESLLLVQCLKLEVRSLFPGGFTLLRFHLHPGLGGTKRDMSTLHVIVQCSGHQP